jgi:hypothetical protein
MHADSQRQTITSTGNRNFYSDVPLEDIVIEKAEVLPDAQ